jgi:hypothetical protein
MAQACGEAYIPGPAFIPGEHFDPFDPEDREIISDVMTRHKMEEDRRIMRENDALRRENDRLRKIIDPDYDPDDAYEAELRADWD